MAIYLKENARADDIIEVLTSGESTQRRQDAYEDQKILDGLQIDAIEKRLRTLYPKSFKSLRISDIQIVKKIIEKRARAYSNQPERKCKDDKETELINKIYKDDVYDAAFEDFDRTFNYFNYGFIWVMPYLINDKPEWGFKIRNLRPFEFDMIFDTRTGEPWAFAICYDTSGTQGISTRFDVWTLNEIFSFDCFGYNFMNNKGLANSGKSFRIEVKDQGTNGLGILPGAYLQNDTSPGFPVRNNLSERSIAWNIGMTDVKTAIAVQGMGISVFKHDQDIKIEGDLELGKEKSITLPQPKDKDSFPTEFLFVEPKPNIGPSLDVLRFELQLILEDNGIRGKSIVAPTSVEQFSSGFDRLISEADVQYIINKNQNLYASKLEQDVFKVLKEYDKLFNNVDQFKETEDLEVSFDKPKVLISDRETLENLAMRIQLGTVLPYEKHIILDPNLTIAEAKEREEKINKSGIKEEGKPEPGMNGESSANKRPVTSASDAGNGS